MWRKATFAMEISSTSMKVGNATTLATNQGLCPPAADRTSVQLCAITALGLREPRTFLVRLCSRLELGRSRFSPAHAAQLSQSCRSHFAPEEYRRLGPRRVELILRGPT